MKKNYPEKKNEQDEIYFKFVCFLEKGLGKLNDFNLDAVRKTVNSIPNDINVLVREYKIVLIFSAMLHYKDKEQRPQWIDENIEPLIDTFKKIFTKKRTPSNTFRNICDRMMADSVITHCFEQIKEDKEKEDKEQKIDLLDYENFSQKLNRKDLLPIPRLLEERKTCGDIFKKEGKKGQLDTFEKVFKKTYLDNPDSADSPENPENPKKENRIIPSSASNLPLSPLLFTPLQPILPVPLPKALPTLSPRALPTRLPPILPSVRENGSSAQVSSGTALPSIKPLLAAGFYRPPNAATLPMNLGKRPHNYPH